MRPPAGPALAYRKALRSLSDSVAEAIAREVGPLLEASLPRADRREDVDDPGSIRDTIRARLANIKRAFLGKNFDKTIDTVAARTVAANGVEFQRILRIDPRHVSANLAPQIEGFRKENVELIKSIPETLLDDVSRVVDEAWTKGERVESLRTKLQQRYDVSKSKADLIARDQVLKLNAQVTQSRQTASGITEYTWTTSHDERVRGNPDGKYPDSDSDHYSLDGTVQRWDAPPVTNQKTGETNHPGEDYQCRCVAVPVLAFLNDPDLADDGEA